MPSLEADDGSHPDVPVSVPGRLRANRQDQLTRPFAVIRTTCDRMSTPDASGSSAL